MFTVRELRNVYDYYTNDNEKAWSTIYVRYEPA